MRRRANSFMRLAKALSLPDGPMRRARTVRACVRGEPGASSTKRMHSPPPPRYHYSKFLAFL